MRSRRPFPPLEECGNNANSDAVLQLIERKGASATVNAFDAWRQRIE